MQIWQGGKRGRSGEQETARSCGQLFSPMHGLALHGLALLSPGTRLLVRDSNTFLPT
jgi:hypothetical protein